MGVKEFVEITRPSNALFSGIAVLIGALVAGGGFLDIFKIISVFFVAIFACAGGNTINDYFDYEIDKINAPKRVLPRGAMSLRTAYIFSIVSFIISCIFAFMVNLLAFSICVAACILMYIYAKTLKRKPFSGNLLVSFLTSITFIYGGTAVGSYKGVSILALISFFAMVSREVVKDIEDLEGDVKKGAKTLPSIIGVRKSFNLAFIFLVIAAFLLFMPFITGLYGYIYLGIVTPVVIYVFFILHGILKNKDNPGKIQRHVKTAMYLVLVIFLLSAIIYGIM
ncbi:MAG: Digeranylgeranylglyceryl phosphate synthase [Candidatus Methanofastidiosum methylothiophilum]|uniref:Digeranylgeranylglyceryl phosphate synthase n=1 Tax=Candidatus Methanofastidiosum methylothiophilum TaxID=1705564 RepID=A0A150IR80_9EURY|nr:MAG: Digeranylgeranylglyceryl phosphate synthase [Candidatus Methanofastidiosum methylthiophilus]KYC47402.1 MAG: Digeranylgeranylglyceryl phosphate synthase [Candidatus Methanofastidiosum methylthiophilus]KYC48890.1 MAG: Digeranylgeranylglyceryl phosphate synthase [Candidatus Methanofastidiosum methylthiophilus]